jgi:hypothetical protein
MVAIGDQAGLPLQGTSQVVATRPQQPKLNTIWQNPATGDSEQWNGSEWIKLTRLNQIISSFGSGADGDVIISVDTTLTRDMFYNNLTINSGIFLNTAGYRVFVRGTLGGSGTIRNNGGAGGNGGDGGELSGDAGTAGTATTGAYLPASIAGKAGGAGQSNGVARGTGTAGANITNSIGSNGVAGGQGGLVGPGSNGGGAGGTVTAMPATAGTHYDLQMMILWRAFPDAASPISFRGGAGSGSGSGGQSTATAGHGSGGGGGGSGGTGGCVLVCASVITGGFVVEAKGGAGGDGGDGGNGVNGFGARNGGGGGGGGGGGNGGIIVFIYSQNDSWTGSLDVSGGAGGIKGIGGTQINGGTNGSDGTNGTDGATGVTVTFAVSA